MAGLRLALILAFIVGTAWNLWQVSGAIPSGHPFDNVLKLVRNSVHAAPSEIVLVAGIGVVWMLASAYQKQRR